MKRLFIVQQKEKEKTPKEKIKEALKTAAASTLISSLLYLSDAYGSVREQSIPSVKVIQSEPIKEIRESTPEKRDVFEVSFNYNPHQIITTNGIFGDSEVRNIILHIIRDPSFIATIKVKEDEFVLMHSNSSETFQSINRYKIPKDIPSKSIDNYIIKNILITDDPKDVIKKPNDVIIMGLERQSTIFVYNGQNKFTQFVFFKETKKEDPYPYAICVQKFGKTYLYFYKDGTPSYLKEDINSVLRIVPDLEREVPIKQCLQPDHTFFDSDYDYRNKNIEDLPTLSNRDKPNLSDKEILERMNIPPENMSRYPEEMISNTIDILKRGAPKKGSKGVILFLTAHSDYNGSFSSVYNIKHHLKEGYEPVILEFGDKRDFIDQILFYADMMKVPADLIYIRGHGEPYRIEDLYLPLIQDSFSSKQMLASIGKVIKPTGTIILESCNAGKSEDGIAYDLSKWFNNVRIFAAPYVTGIPSYRYWFARDSTLLVQYVQFDPSDNVTVDSKQDSDLKSNIFVNDQPIIESLIIPPVFYNNVIFNNNVALITTSDFKGEGKVNLNLNHFSMVHLRSAQFSSNLRLNAVLLPTDNPVFDFGINLNTFSLSRAGDDYEAYYTDNYLISHYFVGFSLAPLAIADTLYFLNSDIFPGFHMIFPIPNAGLTLKKEDTFERFFFNFYSGFSSLSWGKIIKQLNTPSYTKDGVASLYGLTFEQTDTHKSTYFSSVLSFHERSYNLDGKTKDEIPYIDLSLNAHYIRFPKIGVYTSLIYNSFEHYDLYSKYFSADFQVFLYRDSYTSWGIGGGYIYSNSSFEKPFSAGYVGLYYDISNIDPVFAIQLIKLGGGILFNDHLIAPYFGFSFDNRSFYEWLFREITKK